MRSAIEARHRPSVDESLWEIIVSETRGLMRASSKRQRFAGAGDGAARFSSVTASTRIARWPASASPVNHQAVQFVEERTKIHPDVRDVKLFCAGLDGFF
jgi:hypothetical protein